MRVLCVKFPFNFSSWTEVRVHLLSDVETALQGFQKLWDQMGIAHEGQQKRRIALREHVINLLQHLLEEEEKALQQKIKRVDQLREKLVRVCRDLKVSHLQYEVIYVKGLQISWQINLLPKDGINKK